MQKLKIIFVNLILFLILFHVVDFYCSIKNPTYNWAYKYTKGINFFKYIKYYSLTHKCTIKFDKKNAQKYILTDEYASVNEKQSWKKYRPIENKDAQNSILIFGCSYTYGEHLSNKETFSYRLGQNLPNYAIYTRARGGWTTSHMLYQLENKDFSNIKNLKYVIYVFMVDHFSRNQNNHIPVQTPYYKNTEYGIVKFQKYTIKNMTCPVTTFLKQKYIDKLYKDLYDNIKIRELPKEIKSDIDLTKNIILYTKDILDNEYRGTKFIILRYDRGESESYNYMFDELKKDGITVLSVSELSNKVYFAPSYIYSDWHPKSKAWKEITPLFVKYMQARGYLKD